MLCILIFCIFIFLYVSCLNGVLTVRSQVTHTTYPPPIISPGHDLSDGTRNTFCNLDTNILCKLQKYILQFRQILFAICLNIVVAVLTTPHYLTWSWSVRQNKTWQNYPLWNTKRQTSVAGSVMRLKLEGHDIHNLKPRKHHDYILSVLVQISVTVRESRMAQWKASINIGRRKATRYGNIIISIIVYH